ncbi:MAG: hypothetical protein P8049_06015, partial [Gemmatimonadota bacterium]
ADFDTKGYWHNKNGLTELMKSEDSEPNGIPDLIEYVNGLAPYASVCPADDFFGAGDKDFDGEFCDGSPVASAFGDGEFQGVQVAVEGSWQAEVSHFLVDPVNDGGQCEMLTEQLLAFIFNVEFNLGGGGLLVLPDMSTASAQSLIDDAIDAWIAGDEDDCTDWAALLDGFNNDDSVEYVPDTYCAFNYTD